VSRQTEYLDGIPEIKSSRLRRHWCKWSMNARRESFTPAHPSLPSTSPSTHSRSGWPVVKAASCSRLGWGARVRNVVLEPPRKSNYNEHAQQYILRVSTYSDFLRKILPRSNPNAKLLPPSFRCGLLKTPGNETEEPQAGTEKGWYHRKIQARAQPHQRSGWTHPFTILLRLHPHCPRPFFSHRQAT
jgi:hypothetical protein